MKAAMGNSFLGEAVGVSFHRLSLKTRFQLLHNLCLYKEHSQSITHEVEIDKTRLFWLICVVGDFAPKLIKEIEDFNRNRSLTDQISFVLSVNQNQMKLLENFALVQSSTDNTCTLLYVAFSLLR